MDAVDFLTAQREMCESYNPCDGCPLFAPGEVGDTACRDYVDTHPEKAVNIVEQWLKDHGGRILNRRPRPAHPERSGRTR